MVGTPEYLGVAFVVTADAHAAMGAAVQKDMDLPVEISREDDGLRAHLGDEVVARILDLALVPDVEPSAAEYPSFFFLVDVFIHEDLATDLAGGRIDHRRGPTN